MCGYFSMIFIDFMLKGYTNYTKIIRSYSLLMNMEIITEYYLNIFNNSTLENVKYFLS